MTPISLPHVLTHALAKHMSTHISHSHPFAAMVFVIVSFVFLCCCVAGVLLAPCLSVLTLCHIL